jgi:hypothetical protein
LSFNSGDTYYSSENNQGKINTAAEVSIAYFAKKKLNTAYIASLEIHVTKGQDPESQNEDLHFYIPNSNSPKTLIILQHQAYQDNKIPNSMLERQQQPGSRFFYPTLSSGHLLRAGVVHGKGMKRKNKHSNTLPFASHRDASNILYQSWSGAHCQLSSFL